MTKNLDNPGRFLRFSIGLILLILAWWYSSWILLAAAIFTFAEALLSWCIVYQIFGINKCKIK